MRSREAISSEEFNNLLDWLDPDRDNAGLKYEVIRCALIQMFEGHKCIDPENLADQTIDRVSLRVEDLRDTYIGNQALYFHGVARKLLYEYHRSRREINIEVEHAEEAPEIFGAEYECLRECLAELSPQHRDLILDYHLDDKSAKIERRRVMASELGVEPGALRIRAHRIRTFLEDCVKKCLSKTD